MSLNVTSIMALVADINFKNILTNKYFLQYLQSVDTVEGINDKELNDIKNLNNDDFFLSALNKNYLYNICHIIKQYAYSLEFTDIELQLSHFNSTDFSDNIFPNKIYNREICTSSDLTLRFIKNINHIETICDKGIREEEYLNTDLISDGKEYLQNLCDELDVVTKCDVYMYFSTEINN